MNTNPYTPPPPDGEVAKHADGPRMAGLRSSTPWWRAIRLGGLLALTLAMTYLYIWVNPPARAVTVAEGIVVWHGEPVAGARVLFHPVLKNNTFGDPMIEFSRQTNADGRFKILARPSNPTTGDFVATVWVDEVYYYKSARSKHDVKLIESCRSPATSPFHITVSSEDGAEIRLDLADAEQDHDASPRDGEEVREAEADDAREWPIAAESDG